ncbi:hypothetical protein HY798_04085 [Candidatus Falkowbacteria bacterium]|nr:hypothetical protein [Candidatus Falkowbacteria bacterium]
MKKLKEILLFLLPIILIAGAGHIIAILRPDIVRATAVFSFVITFVVAVIVLTAFLENIVPQEWKDNFASFLKNIIPPEWKNNFTSFKERGYRQIKETVLFLPAFFLFILSMVIKKEDKGDAEDYPLPENYSPKLYISDHHDAGD